MTTIYKRILKNISMLLVGTCNPAGNTRTHVYF